MAARKNQPALGPQWRMTPKQARFAAEYAKDLNATQAAIRAGYAAKWAVNNAHRLTCVDGVRQAIEAARRRFFRALAMSVEEAAAITAARARVNARDFHDGRGNVKPVTEWTSEMGYQVAGVEVVIKNAKAGDGVTDEVLKLRLVDSNKALDMIHRLHGSYAADKVEVSGGLEIVQARLLAARKRLAETREESSRSDD